MQEGRVYVHAERRIAERCVALYLRHDTPDGNHECGAIQWAPVLQGAKTPCAASLDDTAAQVLMDNLWAAGVRPADAAG